MCAGASPLLSFFDGAFVLNLPERTDRRSAMEAELRRLGDPGPDHAPVFFPATRPADKGDFESAGARGCFLSHLAMLKNAADRGARRVLIMEDDLSFSRFLSCHQHHVANLLAAGEWDIVYLGHVAALEPAGEFVLQEAHGPLLTTHFLAFRGEILKVLIGFLETLLTRPAGHPDGGPMHVDGAYSTFRQQHPAVRTLIANPSLGFQRSSTSDIRGARWFDTIPFASAAMSVLRTIKTRKMRERF